MSALLDAVDYCRDLLLADSNLVNGDGGDINGVASRVYWNFAPAADQQVYPFAIGNVSAAPVNSTYAIQLLEYRLVWLIISESMVEAAYLGERVYQALHDASPADKTSWVVYSCTALSRIHEPRIESERRYYRDGAIFSVKLNELRV